MHMYSGIYCYSAHDVVALVTCYWLSSSFVTVDDGGCIYASCGVESYVCFPSVICYYGSAL